MRAFTVALIGADGAGKTTVGRKLEGALPIPVKYLYMGSNVEASNALLPTTRVLHAFKRARGEGPTGGPPDPTRRKPPARGFVRRSLRAAREVLGLANRLAEEWFRQGIAWYHVSRGRIVIFDRHFYSDYYAHDIAGNARDRTWNRRAHGFVLRHFYPKPDIVILLDAPPDVLWARKQEGTLEALTRRREEYLRMRDEVRAFAVVDATQSQDVVLGSVARLILERRERENANA
jgi:thymidylate kinase